MADEEQVNCMNLNLKINKKKELKLKMDFINVDFILDANNSRKGTA